MTFAAAPVVTPERSEDGVAEREFGFANIAANKVAMERRVAQVTAIQRRDEGVRRGRASLMAEEQFAGEEQAGAAVHQQPGGFADRQQMRGAVVICAVQQIIAAEEPLM